MENIPKRIEEIGKMTPRDKSLAENFNKKEKGWPSGFEVIGIKEFPYHKNVIKALQDSADLYGYKQIQTPLICDVSWVQAKGAGSQEIKSEMFGITRLKQEGSTNLVLRFENTLSLAKYLTSHSQEIPLPFRRFEIGSVFRGERAQKGRKREFTQADLDVVGLGYPWAETEVLSITAEILNKLSFPKETKIHLNDRAFLGSLIEKIENSDDNSLITGVMREVDKLDKKSAEDVTTEAQKNGLPISAIKKIIELSDKVSLIENPYKSLLKLREIIKNDGLLTSKIDQSLQSMEQLLSLLGPTIDRIKIDPRLTRGLEYYTGVVFEVLHPGISGSLCGGGRYDRLIKEIGGPDIKAIGFAFGIDRMVGAMKQLEIKNKENIDQKGIAIVTFGGNATLYTLGIANKIRELDIPAILISPEINVGKQMGKVSQAEFPFSIVIGDDEVKNKTIIIKNMETREQMTVKEDQIENKLSEIMKKFSHK